MTGCTWALALALVSAYAFGCTIEDISDELRITAQVVPPDTSGTPFRLSRTLTLGQDTSAVDRGEITHVRIAVLAPDGEDLSALLRVSIYAVFNQERSLVAEGIDFLDGETSRELSVVYTADIKPLLAASELELQWEVFPTSQAGAFPTGGLELETVIGFNIDVEIL